MARLKKQRQTHDHSRQILSDETLEHIAACPVGGSGEGSYITGRIQSMANELLYRRRKDEEQCGLQFILVAQSQ